MICDNYKMENKWDCWTLCTGFCLFMKKHTVSMWLFCRNAQQTNDNTACSALVMTSSLLFLTTGNKWLLRIWNRLEQVLLQKQIDEMKMLTCEWLLRVAIISIYYVHLFVNRGRNWPNVLITLILLDGGINLREVVKNNKT